MLQYILTGLAGIALGIVGLRVWQAREAKAPEAQDDESAAAPPATTRKLLISAGIMALAAIAVFALRSPHETPSAGAGGMASLGGAGGKPVDDVDTMIARLADRLAKNPDDGEGFRMLGWSYVMTGHPDKAIEPYKHARTLLPNQANVHAGYGEALVAVAKNTVTPEARAAFEKAVSIDPTEPRARYFLALWQAQHGQQKEALEKWVALANGGPADAPWQVDLRKQISETSARIGVDVSSRLKGPAPASTEPPAIDSATIQAASQLPAGDRQAMVDQMVEGLAGKLKANPGDAEGWVRLLRSRMVLQQGEKAANDLAIARQALANDRAGLAKVNAAAVEFSVPGAK